jgi:hypothetical protein
MKYLLLFLLIPGLFFSACKKETTAPVTNNLAQFKVTDTNKISVLNLPGVWKLSRQEKFMIDNESYGEKGSIYFIEQWELHNSFFKGYISSNHQDALTGHWSLNDSLFSVTATNYSRVGSVFWTDTLYLKKIDTHHIVLTTRSCNIFTNDGGCDYIITGHCYFKLYYTRIED